MKKLFIPLVDFFLPRFCLGCGKALLPADNVLCLNCFRSIPTPSPELLIEEFSYKFHADNFIEGMICAFIFEKESTLQKIIHALKYENKSSLGIYLGKLIYRLNQDILHEWEIDLILPVPLYGLKKAERGYNQSLYIAKGINEELKTNLSTGDLKRKKYTPSQTKLNTVERKANVSDAFKIKNTKNIRGKNILLVDDVITTGSTINECARILSGAGAGKIFAASSAIANPLHSIGSV